MAKKAELKTKKNDASVDEFMSSVADEQKRADAIAVCELMSEVTKEKPVMWGSSIVGFGDYTYRSPKTGREGSWFLVGFSPRKANLTLYIMTGFPKFEGLMKKLGKYSTGKSCLYIKSLDDVNLDVLKELVKKSSDSLRRGETPNY